MSQILRTSPPLNTSRTMVTALSMLVAIVAVAVIDYITGIQISVAILYVVPIVIGTWRLGRRFGVLLCVVGGLAWLAVALQSRAYSYPAITYWNAAVRFGLFLIIAVLVARQREILKQLDELAFTDSLTGAVNVRGFYEWAAMEIERVRRKPRPLTMVYFDLDNFKQVNDRLGHMVGDELLRTIVQTIDEHKRKPDMLARLGGDEFAMVLPETDAEGADAYLRRIMESVLAAMQARNWPVTLSIGIVTYETPPENVETMVRRADAAMYAAKHGGKNQLRHEVVAAETSEEDVGVADAGSRT